MELKSKYFKILMSIFILLFFIVILSPFSFGIELQHYSDIETFVNSSSFYQNLYSQYDNIVLMYSGINGQSIRYNYFFSNNNELILTSNENISNNTFDIYVNGFDYNWYVYYYMTSGRVFSNDFNSGMPIATNIPYEDSFISSVNQDFIIIKGSPVITYNGSPISSGDNNFDFSFVIKDNSTNTEHSFDFNFVDCEFNDGRSFTADDLTEGHYIVSVNNLVHNSYDLVSSTEDTYWVSGFIDYVDFDDTQGSKTQFYWSSGYNIPKILNETSNSIKVYRFYFKGYSNDSFAYEELSEGTNFVGMKFNNEYMYDYNYSYPSGTFAYSNKDIYYGIDSSIYGYNGLSSRKFFDESLYETLEVNSINQRDYPSDISYIDSEVTTFALNNDAYSYPSSYVDFKTECLIGFRGENIDNISPYGDIVDYTGTKEIGVDTTNWSVLDYVKHIPEIISNLPNLFEGLFKKLATPNTKQIFDKFDELNEFFLNHFGSFYQPIDYIVGVLKTLVEKYTPGYSNYPFTIPGIRWYNPITQEKQVLVESSTIDLLHYFADDEDWLQFWSTLRYLTSFVIYINLIIMFYNKLRWLLGESSIDLMKVSTQLGDLNINNPYKRNGGVVTSYSRGTGLMVQNNSIIKKG